MSTICWYTEMYVISLFGVQFLFPDAAASGSRGSGHSSELKSELNESHQDETTCQLQFKVCWSVVISLPGRVLNIVISISVCLCVYLHKSKTAWPNFTKFFVHVACGCGSVLLWWLCDTLCTSGFMDDVMFLYHGAHGPESSRMLFIRSSPSGCTSWLSNNYSVWLSNQNVALAAKSAIYDCLIVYVMVLTCITPLLVVLSVYITRWLLIDFLDCEPR